ncbi:TIGR02921 family PEP-CTERM protein [Lyngbya confervoides]|uniref:TIGR02921 family PEP-CTERM protein n=1 Tax=Lyngbya confervoides BDU141951 TaxID=1574623 RepID=A0ABD4T4P1_9CYAN|nr:TIGR02921 family PEP-CTERM protein [Lyngbya confervoides]MCM1983619.1 TIGR02921 family PEP-CTERM protein [Lyngbya confervoides BDU141951]
MSSSSSSPAPSPVKEVFQILFAIFFWLFNGTLLLIVFLGFLPFWGREILSDAARGEVPFSILVPVLGLLGVPTASTAMGTLRQIHRRKASPARPPLSLFQIFYGIEAPLLTIFTLRLFFLRDLTPAATFLCGTVALGSLALIHWLLTAQHPETERATWGHLAGLTLMLVSVLYLAAIALFYLPPTLWFVGAGILFILVYFVILFPVAVMTLGWITMPFGMAALFFNSWRQIAQQLGRRGGTEKVLAAVGLVLAVWLGLLAMLQQQPQHRAFELLASQPAPSQTVQEHRQALLKESETIRQGLLNAYLAPYRYPLLESQGIFNLYQSLLGDRLAQMMQSAYNVVIAPFAYQGPGTDPDKAASLYAEFFDTPILRGEQAAIQRALQSTFDRAQAKAGLLDVRAERVKLEQQDIQVTPHGDWAEIELHEVYANTTFDQTEVLYLFSLPESATITGLWLGETGDRAQRYDPIVSTRGAAQQVYNDQLQQRVDPALLEQVGPRNYRLRAFPIPPMNQDQLPQDGQPDRMHLWMTYQVMQQAGQWPLPQLHEQRNIFWRNSTRRTLNGVSQRGHKQWLPASLPAEPMAPMAHQTQLPGGYLLANPIDETAYTLPTGQHLALILDGSYSMKAHQRELKATFAWLQEAILPNNPTDLFLTQIGSDPATPVTEVQTFQPEEALFYGRIQPSQMLRQFNQAIAGTSKSYDAIVLITDTGSYELTEDSDDPVAITAPLWLVHVGGLQPAYDDATLEAIQRTGGSVSTQVQEVMTRIATQPSLGPGTSLLNVVDGYAWFLSQRPDPQVPITPDLDPMAARQWVAQVSESVQPEELAQLDAIHALAQQNQIVTPYSSMLVLVNADQKRQLQAAEDREDRFDREVEDQQLPQPQQALAPVSGVPEPAEWLLFLAGTGLLGLLYWQRMMNLQAVPSGTEAEDAPHLSLEPWSRPRR